MLSLTEQNRTGHPSASNFAHMLRQSRCIRQQQLQLQLHQLQHYRVSERARARERERDREMWEMAVLYTVGQTERQRNVCVGFSVSCSSSRSGSGGLSSLGSSAYSWLLHTTNWILCKGFALCPPSNALFSNHHPAQLLALSFSSPASLSLSLSSWRRHLWPVVCLNNNLVFCFPFSWLFVCSAKLNAAFEYYVYPCASHVCFAVFLLLFLPRLRVLLSFNAPAFACLAQCFLLLLLLLPLFPSAPCCFLGCQTPICRLDVNEKLCYRTVKLMLLCVRMEVYFLLHCSCKLPAFSAN